MIHSQESWRNGLLALPEKKFFDLIRNYLGPVETPYNKQNLLDRLIDFLSSRHHLEKIYSCLDEKESAILSVLYYHPGIPEETLYHFMSHYFSRRMLHWKIKNLMERLLLFKRDENGVSLFYITPFFLDILHEGGLSPLDLISGSTPDWQTSPQPWFNDNFMQTFCAFLLQENANLNGHSLRKKDRNRFQQLFQSVGNHIPLEEAEELALTAVLRSGLFRSDGDSLEFSEDAAWTIKRLPADKRWLLWQAASYSTDIPLSAVYASIAVLTSSLPAGKSYSKDGLMRVFPLLERKMEIKESKSRMLNSLFQHLERLNVFYYNNLDDSFALTPEPLFQDSEESLIPLHGNFECSVPVDSAFRPELINLFSPKRFDIISEWELSKNLFRQYLERGGTVSGAENNLKSLSGQIPPENYILTLSEWENDLHSVQFFRGIVIVLNESKMHLVRETGVLDTYIKRKLGPGTLLLGEQDRQEWSIVLEDLGIPVPSHINDFERTPVFELDIPDFSALSHIEHTAGINKIDIVDKEKLSDVVRSKKWDQETEEEFLLRIRRKTVIDEKQLKPEILRKEMMTARGIDFTGKVNLIESAIRSDTDHLELTVQSGDEFSLEKIIVVPLKLDKKEGDVQLQGYFAENGEDCYFQVSKIAGIRRIRQCLL